MKPSWTRTGEILFLSRIHVKKGINFLIEAIARLKDEYAAEQKEIPVSRCIVAGEGDEAYISELRDMAARLGVGDIFDFVGGVYGDRKWELFRRADLFVLPTHSENFGIVVAEALAGGTPVITTTGTPWQELDGAKEDEGCVNNPDAMPKGKCGWWTEVGTEPTLNAMKEFLLCSEADLEQMGRNGRRLIEERYSCKKVAKEMVDLYKTISK